MLKIILFATVIGISFARPGGLGLVGYGYGGDTVLGGTLSGVGFHGLGHLVPSSGVSTSSRVDIVSPAVAYSAGSPIHGLSALPHGVNAGYSHASRVSILTPVIGTVATGYGGHGYGGHGYGGLGYEGHGYAGHVLGGHY